MRERGPSGMLWRTGGGPSYPLGPLGLWEGRVRPGAPMASVPPPICSVLVTKTQGPWVDHCPLGECTSGHV